MKSLVFGLWGGSKSAATWEITRCFTRKGTRNACANLSHTEAMTDRIAQLEQELADTNRRLGLVLEAASEGFWEWDIKTGRVYYSPAWISSLGYAPDEVPPHVSFWESIVHSDDLPRVEQALRSHWEGRTPVYECETRLRAKSGAWRWTLDRGKVIDWDSDGSPLRMVGTDTDVSARKQAEEALLDSVSKLQAYLESASQGVVTVNARGQIELVNARTEEMFGYRREELLGQTLELLLPERYRAAHAEHRGRYFSRPGVRPMGLGLELAGLRKDGTEFPIEIGLSYIRTKDGTVAMGLITEITERKRAEETLKASEQRLRLMVENLPAGAVYVEGDSLFVNRATEQITGYARGEIATFDQWFRALYGKDHRAVRKLYQEDRQAGFPHPRTVPLTRKDGQVRFMEFAAYRYEQGEVWLVHDITELKRAEERATMLKEIHHRVKNNLQVVSSLLGLQARGIPDEQIRRMFQESQNRIQSMALLHERLYQSEDLCEIDCREYVQQLASHLFRSYGVSSSRVQLKVRLDEVHLSLDAAVPCGLIVNELVSNCLKHAFPDGRQGEIRIEAHKDPDHQMKLVVADNGVGLPKDVSVWNARSLGLRLVRTLAEQLGAAVEVQSTSGTEIRLTFPTAADQARSR